VRHREAAESQQVLGGVTQHGLKLGELPAQHPSDHVELLMDVGSVQGSGVLSICPIVR
jgi:hypothetical protein